jgi:hypothetical protein
MKNKKVLILILFILVLLPLGSLMAAPPPPPPPPGPSSGHVFIGGAPIGSGLVLLVSLALGYGLRKYYNARKRRISE